MKQIRIIGIIIFTLLLFDLAAQIDNDLIGKPQSSYPGSKSVVENKFDSLIQVKYDLVLMDEEFKYINIISFKDSIFYVKTWFDNSLYGETNILDTILVDSTLFKKANNYFNDKYSTDIDLNSLPRNYLELRESFGLACGANGTPRGLAIKFQELDINNFDENNLTKLLTSLNPQDQLFAYLLFDPTLHDTPENLVELVKNSTFKYNFCSGCTVRLTLSIDEIKNKIK